MYPNANIPVVQLSIDSIKPPLFHYELGMKLKALRDEGILIVGSGNVAHNLNAQKNESEPYLWAYSFNQYVRENLNWQGSAAEHPLVNLMQHEGAALSCPTLEHYLLLLYTLGSRQNNESVSISTHIILAGSISMLSIQIG